MGGKTDRSNSVLVAAVRSVSWGSLRGMARPMAQPRSPESNLTLSLSEPFFRPISHLGAAEVGSAPATRSSTRADAALLKWVTQVPGRVRASWNNQFLFAVPPGNEPSGASL